LKLEYLALKQTKLARPFRRAKLAFAEAISFDLPYPDRGHSADQPTNLVDLLRIEIFQRTDSWNANFTYIQQDENKGFAVGK
jgi:hypothetical protein